MEHPYKIRLENPTPELLAQARRTLTRQFILDAAAQLYPAGLARKEGRVLASILDAVEDDQPEIELDGTQVKALCELFFNDTVKFRPIAAAWYYQWLDYLEVVRAGV